MDKKERNIEVANEKALLMHYMQTRSFFLPTAPIDRTYVALQKCGYPIAEFSTDDIAEITEILKAKNTASNDGCVTVMLIVFAIIASILSKGLLIPVFALLIFLQYRKRKKNLHGQAH